MRLIDADKLDMSVKVDGDRTLSPISQLIAQTIIENAQTIESDEDCISRKAVLNTLDSMDKALTEDRTVEEYKEVLKECYKVLPSVQPKPKTGHWISNECGQYCDKCGNGINTPYKFCPFCGADMREYKSETPTDSEKEE